MLRAMLFVSIVLLPLPAVAQERAPEPKEHAISLHLLGLVSGGIALSYERFPVRARSWSFAFSVGTRLPAGGDYASFALGLGAEARWWAFNDAEGADDDRLDGGFFVSGRIEGGWTHVWDTVQDRAVGDTLSITHTLSVGWRFDVARTIEVTPSLGLALTHEFDPGGTLAAWTRGSPTVSLTVGWMP